MTYQGEHFKRLVIERLTATDDEMKEAIKQMGLEEAQKSLNEVTGAGCRLCARLVDFKASAVQ